VNDSAVVADASAVIAHLVGEPFALLSPRRLANAWISAVNLSEVLTRMPELGVPDTVTDAAVEKLNLRVVAFDQAQAAAAARLRPATRHAGLSLGDRACLALAQRLGCPAVTADRAWATVGVGVEVVLIR
jgi:ribonuclease VapC